jgi:hypothetical protein
MVTSGWVESAGRILSSVPVGDDPPTGWQGSAAVDDVANGSADLSVFAVCVDVPPRHREAATTEPAAVDS